MEQKQYFAFISYKREDEKWASWLQHKLEHYKLPSNLNGRTDLPKYIRPVFKDTSELSAGVLADEIKAALDQSKYLIVICSPNVSKSKWVNKEAQSFIDSGRADRIIPFIIDGMPNSGDPETECFPLAIRELPEAKELLGVNIKEMGRDAAGVKVISQMLGLSFDLLWQRHERERKRRLLFGIIVAVSIALIGLTIGVSYYRKNRSLLENQARFISEKAISLIEDNDSYSASKLALAVLPQNLNFPRRPYTTEAEIALRRSLKENTGVFRGHTNPVNTVLFCPNGTQAVSTSDDNTMIIWELESGAIAKRVELPVGSASFHPNGKQLATSCSDGLIHIWDTTTWEDVFSKEGSFPVFSADGSFLLTKGGDGVYLYNTSTWEREKEYVYYYSLEDKVYSALYSIAISPDGKHFVTASADCTVRIWDIETGKVLSVYEHDDRVTSAVYSPDGKMIVTGSWDGSVRCWAADGTRELKRLCLPQSNSPMYSCIDDDVRSVSINHDGTRIICGTSDNKIYMWDVDTGNLINTFSGHHGWVNSVCFSPSGDYMLSASNDKTVRLWSLKSADSIILRGYESAITSIAYSPTGDTFAAGTRDNTIHLWDAETNNELRQFVGHTDYVNAVSYSPDGRMLVSGSGDKTVRIWEVATGKELLSLTGHDSYVTTVSFSPDGKTFLSGSGDNTVRLWNTQTGKAQKVFKCPDVVTCASFSPNGRKIAVGLIDCRVLLWDVKNEKIEDVIYGMGGNGVVFGPNGERIVADSYDHFSLFIWDIKRRGVTDTLYLGARRAYAKSIAISPDGTIIAAGSYNYNAVQIFKKEEEDTWSECYSKLQEENSPVSAVAFSPDGKTLVYGMQDNSIKQLNFDNVKETVVREEALSSISSITINPDETRVAIGLQDNTIRVWDLSSLNEIMVLRGNDGNVIYSPDGKMLASCSKDNSIIVRDAKTFNKLYELKGHANSLIVFSPDSRMIASSDNKRIIVWDISSQKVVTVMKGHSEAITCLEFGPDGGKIASGSWDDTIRIWDVHSGKLLTVFDGHSDYINSISYSPNQKIIASASADGTIKLWNYKSRKEVLSVNTHATSVSFSPDGRLLLSSSNNILRLFDATTGKEIDELDGHTGSVISAIFSPKGHLIVSGSQEDKTVRIWPFSQLQNLIVQSTERFKDAPLSVNERRNYYLD